MNIGTLAAANRVAEGATKKLDMHTNNIKSDSIPARYLLLQSRHKRGGDPLLAADPTACASRMLQKPATDARSIARINREEHDCVSKIQKGLLVHLSDLFATKVSVGSTLCHSVIISQRFRR